MLTTYEFAPSSVSGLVIGSVVAGGLRGTQSRRACIALMKCFGYHGFTECYLQLAKNVSSGALDEVACRWTVLADSTSHASMAVWG